MNDSTQTIPAITIGLDLGDKWSFYCVRPSRGGLVPLRGRRGRQRRRSRRLRGCDLPLELDGKARRPVRVRRGRVGQPRFLSRAFFVGCKGRPFSFVPRVEGADLSLPLAWQKVAVLGGLRCS